MITRSEANSRDQLTTLAWSELLVYTSNGVLPHHFSITPDSLFLNKRAIKNRPGVKACLIGPPEALAVFILFLDWQVK